MDNMFELVLANEKEIVLKVIAKENLENLDKNSYLDANYITVTRGIDHVLEVIKDDMSIFSFSWGFNGHTVISDKFERLKKEVIEFLISKEIFINVTNDEIVKKQFTLINALINGHVELKMPKDKFVYIC